MPRERLAARSNRVPRFFFFFFTQEEEEKKKKKKKDFWNALGANVGVEGKHW